MRWRTLSAVLTATVLAIVACGSDDDSSPRSPVASALPSDPQSLMSVASRISFRDVRATVESDPDPAAVIAMGESGDEQYIPVLIDILRFPWLLGRETEAATNAALEELSGEDLGDGSGWVDWLEWLMDQPDIEPPEGYARWKGNLLTQLVDPNTGAFLVGTPDSTIRLEEIVWGGVPRDGIPDLQSPPVIPAAEAVYLEPDDRVFGVTLNGESRAYPLRIMNAHEMANDELGGVYFALAYCTLCGSGIAYATEVGGEVLSFGTSGLLWRSNKLMYDRGTKSLWNQFGGDPVVGDLAGSGMELEVLPMTLTTWDEWLALHPDTTVLDIETGVYPPGSYPPEDDPNSFYYDYRNNPAAIFPVGDRSDIIPEKEVVLGIEAGGLARAYQVSRLTRGVPVNDTLAGAELVVFSTGDVGAVAYKRDGVTFTSTDTERTLLTDSSGRDWVIEDDALVLDGDPTERLPRLESQIAFWFAWYQFHPLTEVYAPPG